MKLILLLFAFTILTSEKCNEEKKKETADNGTIPSCIQARIDSIKSVPKWNPPAEVHQYSYKGKTVYLFSSDCCDFFNPLFDAECTYICSPSGGITGKGDMKCMDFEKEATMVKLIWKDNR